MGDRIGAASVVAARGWAGPLAVVSCFACAAIATGARMHGTLIRMAERIIQSRSDRPLDPAERRRVGVLARTAMMVFAFTVALSVWGFDAFIS